MKLLIVLYGQDWYDFSSDPYIEAVHSTFTLNRVQKYIDIAQKRVDEQLVPWSMVMMVDLSVEEGTIPTTTILFSKHNVVKEKLELNKEAKKTPPKKTTKTPYMWEFLDGQNVLPVAMPQNGQLVNNELIAAQGQAQAALAELAMEPNLIDEEVEEEEDEDD